MVTTLTFIRAQNEEGVEWEIIDSRTNTPEDLSSVTEITFYCYDQDGLTLLFTGTKTGLEVTVSGASNNIVKFLPSANDMNIEPAIYKGELKIEYATGRIGKIHDLLVKIVDDSPIS